jgi:hypothetical protein
VEGRGRLGKIGPWKGTPPASRVKTLICGGHFTATATIILQPAILGMTTLALVLSYCCRLMGQFKAVIVSFDSV